jgi:hypothetical protein
MFSLGAKQDKGAQGKASKGRQAEADKIKKENVKISPTSHPSLR